MGSLFLVGLSRKKRSYQKVAHGSNFSNAKSGPGPILAAKSGPTGPVVAAKSGPMLPKVFLLEVHFWLTKIGPRSIFVSEKNGPLKNVNL